MAFEIVTIGGLLVEIMRKEIDKPFTGPADLTGPYPSGDAAIFLDTAARLGSRCGMIGCVGDDDFGRCITARLERDGVDTSMIEVKRAASTGVAFVAYFKDGSRDFIFHWSQAAAGMINKAQILPDKLKDVKWAQVSGCNICVNDNCKEAIHYLIDCLPQGAKLSFDPNIRPGALTMDQIREKCAKAFERCDIFFPSRGEAAMFSGEPDDESGCKTIAASGKLVVEKRGADGCRIYSGNEIIDVPSFDVCETDPTGAGDSFCAGFITALSEGKSLFDAGLFANAVGALSVTKFGPMEGAPTRAEVLEFIASRMAK